MVWRHCTRARAPRSAEPPDEILLPLFEPVADVDLVPSFQSARRASDSEEPAQQVLHHPGMREEQPVTSVVFLGHESVSSTLYKTEKTGLILQPLEEYGFAEGVFGSAVPQVDSPCPSRGIPDAPKLKGRRRR